MNKNVKDKIFLTLLCEWSDCSMVFDNMEFYLMHIKQHLDDWRAKVDESGHDHEVISDDQKENNHNSVGSDNNNNGSTEDSPRLSCLWKDCSGNMRLSTWQEMTCHVYYHAFHQKLKCHGIALLRTLAGSPQIDPAGNEPAAPPAGCQLDHGSRNLLPDVSFRLVCCWQGCEARFEVPEWYYAHVVNHVEFYPSGNNVKGGCRCHWENCTVSVKSKHKLRDHLRSHTQEKLFACPTCGGLYANATKFIDHVQRQAEHNSLTYRCSYCSKMFPNKRLLRDHMRHHVYHYKCPFCDMTCPTPSSLRTHIRYRHSNYRPLVCKTCGFTAKLAVDLKKHLEKHNNDWVECQVENCSYRSRHLWDMNLHVRNKHEGIEESKYLCHLCSLKYSKGTYLTKHLKRKHRLREPSGHVRLRYKLHEDGFYRLQEFRYESLELQEQHLVRQDGEGRTNGNDAGDDDDNGGGDDNDIGGVDDDDDDEDDDDDDLYTLNDVTASNENVVASGFESRSAFERRS